MAKEGGIWPWFAYWDLADSRWWLGDPRRSRGATALCGFEDEQQFAWLVPQADDEALLVVDRPGRNELATGPAQPVAAPAAGFDALFGSGRGSPRRAVDALYGLVPWLQTLDANAMARLPIVPGCDVHGFNIRGVRVMNDEKDEWFAYEVYPQSEKRWRRRIVGVVELRPVVVYVRPHDPTHH